MIQYNVPAETPLTKSGNGVEMWVITEMDWGPQGAYPTLERAKQYIDDWLKPLVDENALAYSYQTERDGTVKVIRHGDENESYTISKIEFRY